MSNNYDQNSTYDIFCPYCFKKYQNFRAMFADYRNFTEEIYPEYADYLKHFMNIETVGSRRMPVLFQKRGNDGLDAFAALTESGDVTYSRFCPNCCNPLPAAAGRLKPFSLVVIGAEDTERSFYIASVLHRLNRKMLSAFGSSFIPADFKSAQTFYEQYEEPLYVEKTVPEAMATVTPLVYEFSRTGAALSEEWKGNSIAYNKALFYIYNIDKDLCDRYPMVAYTAIAQASGFIFISDVSEMMGQDDPAYEPWLGYLTDTFRRLFGASAVEIPTAILYTKADKAAMGERKWLSLVKESVSRHIEKSFPTSYYTKIAGKAQTILNAKLPAYSSTISALFSPQTTMSFLAKSFFDMHTDGTADIHECGTVEASFLWMLSELGIINNDKPKSFKIR